MSPALRSPSFTRGVRAALLLGGLCTVAGAQVEEARLDPHDAGPGLQFGAALAIAGDTAVIGALGGGSGGGSPSPTGSVYVYGREGGRWVERQELVPDASEGRFGTALALAGDTLLVGDFTDRAHVFVRGAAGYVEQQVLTGPVSAAFFGAYVALEGDTAVVGAPREFSVGQLGGAAYVFVRLAGAWSLQQRLVPADAAALDGVGECALRGDMLLLAAPGREGMGAVYVYRRTGSTWSEVQKLVASDRQAEDGFGSGLALSGTTAVIGASGADGPAVDGGKVYVFEEQGGVWVETQRLTAGDGERDEDFGRELALDGDTLAVGAPWDDVGADYSGSTYLFRRGGAGFGAPRRITAGDPGLLATFGSALALAGDELLVGAFSHEAVGPNSGRAYALRVLGGEPVTLVGHGLNQDGLTAEPLVTGTTWRATIEVADAHERGVAVLLVSSASQGGMPLLGGAAEYLLAGMPLGRLGPVFHAGQGSSATVRAAVPADPDLIGLEWVAQGVVFGGPLRLTHAVAGLVQ